MRTRYIRTCRPVSYDLGRTVHAKRARRRKEGPTVSGSRSILVLFSVGFSGAVVKMFIV